MPGIANVVQGIPRSLLGDEEVVLSVEISFDDQPTGLYDSNTTIETEFGVVAIDRQSSTGEFC